MKIFRKEVCITICLLIGLILYGVFKYDENKIQLHVTGTTNRNAQVEAIYDGGNYICSLVEEKENYINGEEVVIKCKSKFLPINTHYSRQTIKGLYYPDYGSVCNLIDHFEEEGIRDIVALYMKKGESGMSYFILSKDGENYKGYLEENMFTKFGVKYYQIVNGKVLDKVKIKEYDVENIDELKTQLNINNFELTTEDYEKGITKC